MRIMTIAIALTLLCTPAHAEAPPLGWTTEARVLDVYDGDTITVEVRRVFRVRLLDCWAPEIRGGTAETKRAARSSRDHLRELLGGKTVRLHVPTTERGRVQDLFTFGRILAQVWIGDTNAAQAQVEAGHATKTKE